MATSLYVHMPFCAHICNYCDFCKLLYNEKWAFSYIEELKKEISSFDIKSNSLKTIYVGGGTPTCLNNALLDDLLAFLNPYLIDGGEFTIEGNPENIDEEKLLVLKREGINRLSIGIQSSNEKYLGFLGRKHTFEQARKTIYNAKKAGFNNISVDLIYALPNEKIEDVQNDVDSLLSLDVPHLSTYSLIIEKGTAFYNKGFKEADDDIAAEMYNLILKKLREAGYERYEVSNFARNRKYSKHNLTYWHDEEYYGAGLGASGYLDGVRYTNTKSLSAYLKHEYKLTSEKLTKESELEDFFLTNLRLAEGFRKKTFACRFGFEFKSKYAKQFDKLEKQGLLVENEHSIAPTDLGIILLDRILLELF